MEINLKKPISKPKATSLVNYHQFIRVTLAVSLFNCDGSDNFQGKIIKNSNINEVWVNKDPNRCFYVSCVF